ncbi:MAG: hypothetical protein IT428_16145 [Planctomycetaceae bacterium]|nr:hypothetical protein [Planctomycetaceae bacterium]
MATIELTDVGPIERLSIPVPEDGGLVVLKGRNGAGKSKSLEAVESLVSGRGTAEPRDGKLRGEVSGFGARLTVTKSVRRYGELVVETLEGKLSVADLVDPGLVDPIRADAARIKALVQLSGTTADPELFRAKFVDSDFDEVVQPDTLECNDILRLAALVKRDAERAARQAGTNAEQHEASARAARAALEGLDLNAETDPAVLQANLERAVAAKSALDANKKTADAAAQRAAAAREKLSASQRPNIIHTGGVVNKCCRRLTEVNVKHGELVEALNDAKRKVEESEKLITECEAALEIARSQNDAALRESAAISAAEDAIKAAEALSSPTFTEIEAAQQAVEAARRAIETGAVIRAARSKAAQAEQFAADAASRRKSEADLRAAAKGTDDVLSSLVARPGSPLRVDAGRLVLTTKRGDTYFSDLSEGERWRVALDIAIEAVGEHGLLVIPQTAYESLDPQNRQLIAKHVVGRKVVILTAEASDDAVVTPEVIGGVN